QGVGSRSRQHHLYLRRGAAFPRRSAHHRRRPQGRADRDHAGAGRHRFQSGAVEAQRNPSGDADLSGPADFRQRRARRTASGAGRGRARPETRRTARGGVVPLAGRPYRQEFPGRARQGGRRLAASAGTGAGRAQFSIADQTPRDRRRGRGRGQSARPLGQIARGRTHRGAGARRAGIAGMAGARRHHEGRLIIRILHVLVIGFLVFAAAYVYRIKMESVSRTERVLRLHADIREQRDAIAALRAEWTRLDSPQRLQGLVERHLPLKPIVATQYDSLKNLPERPPNFNRDPDPIGSMISDIDAKIDAKAEGSTPDATDVTGSIPAAAPASAAEARARVGFAILAFAAIYAVIGGRLVMYATIGDSHGNRRTASQDAIATARPDIVDRNGEVLATDVKAPSLFAEPRRLIDKEEAIELLTATLPDLDTGEVRERLSGKKGFVWLKREITPSQQQEIHRLGLPGIGFLRENKRVYPTGAEVAHLIGLVNIDNQGIAGMEKWVDTNGLADLHRAGFATDRQQTPVELSVDLRVEHALRDELLKAKDKFHAKAASGLVSNVKTGEIVAMVSLPDFDPNNPKEAHDPDRINRLTTGVYEMGSTFKAFTLAMALDTGKYGLDSLWDARAPLHYGRFAIHDDEPKGRFLTMKEVFTFSSNIGAARIALAQGVEAHKAFLRK